MNTPSDFRAAWLDLAANLSEGTVRELYDLIRNRLAEEDALPQGVEPRPGIRRFSDFRIQADVFEETMRRRNIEFERIVW